MNPPDYGNGMLWMGQFAPDRMILEDNSMLSVGMSVMDDITQQTHSMVTTRNFFFFYYDFVVALKHACDSIYKKFGFNMR